MSTVKKALKERGKTYGSYKERTKVGRDLRDIVEATDNWAKLEAYQKESLEQVLNKISRILGGDINYVDNWLDIAGYSQLVVDELQNNVKKK